MLDINAFNIGQCDISTLFSYRYVLDKKDDIVDLHQDIRDLRAFPERIADSYQAEWTSYVKRELHNISKRSQKEKAALITSLQMLESGQDEEFEALREIINTAIKVNISPDVTVMTTPLKRYVSQLLTL
ncbi:hypothetical protein ACFO4O_00300 [Glaciecola siphonariae]|uniref:Uncharacterized protein n=1 Tax=Glaciecola siphonariae TaxID=521012 RepID=A0ABV9LQ71_9ALTE